MKNMDCGDADFLEFETALLLFFHVEQLSNVPVRTGGAIISSGGVCYSRGCYQ
jgi:hypothetical protein